METIDHQTLQLWLTEGRPVTILDVRPAAEHAEWAIPGSLHVEAYDALKRNDRQVLETLDLPGDRPVVTVCGAGRISLVAAEALQQRGLQAFSLSGGMRSWSLAWNTAELDLSNGVRVVQVRRTGKGCLSYLVGSQGSAVVLDAALEPDVYRDLAKAHGWRITHVIDSHIHADHLSRSRALSEVTGARLYLPAQERVAFPFVPLHDQDMLMVGDVRITVLHTPGHTLESSCFLLDHQALFSGDTLFLSAVGRPDLHAGAEGAQSRARMLHKSLQRLLQLPTSVQVLPGHTSEPVAFDRRLISATLAQVEAKIERLRLSEGAFIDSILGRLPATPPNHELIVALNQAGDLAADPIALEAGANRCAAL